MPRLREFIEYARLDAADKSAEVCYRAAMQAAIDAGIPEGTVFEGDARAALYIYALAAHYYDNRGAGDDAFIRTTLNKIRTELMYR